jgi:regulatory protein
MQIVAINPSRKSQQIWLKFDNDSLLPLKVDDLISLKLVKYSDLSEGQYQQVQEASAKYLLLEYSLRQIAISPKVESLLRQKLKIYCHRLVTKYSLPLDILDKHINSTINKLSQDGLLDQHKYIEHLQRIYPKKSIFELNYLAHRLGITDSISVDNDHELAKIKAIVRQKSRSMNLMNYQARNKLIANLNRKGFPINIIKNAIDECLKVS